MQPSESIRTNVYQRYIWGVAVLLTISVVGLYYVKVGTLLPQSHYCRGETFNWRVPRRRQLRHASVAFMEGRRRLCLGLLRGCVAGNDLGFGARFRCRSADTKSVAVQGFGRQAF